MSEGVGRLLMGAGGLTRLSYGLGALLAPDSMCSHSLAPDVRGHADGRMDFRGFGGLHVSIAVLTLRAAACNRNTRLLLGLSLGCELSDMAVTLLEWRDRGEADRTVDRESGPRDCRPGHLDQCAAPAERLRNHGPAATVYHWVSWLFALLSSRRPASKPRSCCFAGLVGSACA